MTTGGVDEVHDVENVKGRCRCYQQLAQKASFRGEAKAESDAYSVNLVIEWDS